MKSFTDLGLSYQLVEVCEKQVGMGWYDPRKIQSKVIPIALHGGKDVFAISPPRSGKTAAYVLPIFQALLDAGPNINPFFACVISPTRLLAFEIARYFEAVGQHFDVKVALLVATSDMVYQTNEILKKPHIIVGTPGKIIRHLKDTQAFSLAKLKYLVIDEAHLLESNKHIDRQLEYILGTIPRNRTTLLFSDSMTDKVHTIQSMYLRNPVKIDESIEYPEQQQCRMSAEHKDCYLAYTLNKMGGKTALVFARVCELMLRLALTLRNFGFNVIPINDLMSQAKRLEALNVFKSGKCNILICNEGASRGLDIPAVDMVINYDIPNDPRDYMHRVGWAVPSGVAISFVNSKEERWFEMIETHIGKKLPVYPAQNEEVLLLSSRVSEAKSLADKEMNESGWRSGGYLGEEAVRKIESAYSRKHVKVYVDPELLETLKQQHEKTQEFIWATENSENSADGDTVVIKTNDGVAHEVERVFGVQILTKYGLAASETEFELSNVGSKALETVISLLKELQANQKIDVGDFSNEQLKDLVLAVYHLGFTELQNFLCQVIADRLQNKSKEYMQTFFGFQEEESKLKEEDA